MANFLTIFVLTFGLVACAFLGFLIGWFVRGKPLERGCGKKPVQGKECNSAASCSLCGEEDACTKKPEEGKDHGEKGQGASL